MYYNTVPIQYHGCRSVVVLKLSRRLFKHQFSNYRLVGMADKEKISTGWYSSVRPILTYNLGLHNIWQNSFLICLSSSWENPAGVTNVTETNTSNLKSTDECPHVSYNVNRLQLIQCHIQPIFDLRQEKSKLVLISENLQQGDPAQNFVVSPVKDLH